MSAYRLFVVVRRVSAFMLVICLGGIAFLALGAAGTQDKREASIRKFSFGPGAAEPGYEKVTPDTIFTAERGFGFDLDSKATTVERAGGRFGGFCTSARPFYFSVQLPEGNYDVTVVLGDSGGTSATTVRAESRRLMLENVRTAQGDLLTRSFTTNIRTAKLASGGQVKLKDRETGVLHWDDKLTIEFRGERPCLCALEVKPNLTATTVYLAGDSTVTDQVQKNETFTSWGQILPRFFKPGGVSIANHAESGEATTSFIGAKRLEKILDSLKKGDYLFVQFGHNDQNQKREVATYKATLQRYIAEARNRGATAVLLTPIRRRTFDKDGKSTNTLGDYPDAVRKLAAEERVMLIDLNAMSGDFYEALGASGSKNAFVDNTHTNPYGAYAFARYIAEQIKNSELGLASQVVDDLPAADFKSKLPQEP
jgi:lysophospholipase L1-like esterase